MLLNTEVETLLNSLRVNGKAVEYAYMFYDGHADTYIVYSQSDTMNSYSGDDNILGVVPVYDFDIYSKTNYGAIESGLRSLLTSNNWTWQPNRDSPDLYDKDTGFYHKTCAYAKPLQI